MFSTSFERYIQLKLLPEFVKQYLIKNDDTSLSSHTEYIWVFSSTLETITSTKGNKVSYVSYVCTRNSLHILSYLLYLTSIYTIVLGRWNNLCYYYTLRYINPKYLFIVHECQKLMKSISIMGSLFSLDLTSILSSFFKLSRC